MRNATIFSILVLGYLKDDEGKSVTLNKLPEEANKMFCLAKYKIKFLPNN